MKWHTWKILLAQPKTLIILKVELWLPCHYGVFFNLNGLTCYQRDEVERSLKMVPISYAIQITIHMDQSLNIRVSDQSLIRTDNTPQKKRSISYPHPTPTIVDNVVAYYGIFNVSIIRSEQQMPIYLECSGCKMLKVRYPF